MPSLNFEAGPNARPVALAKGGSYDGEVLYLHEGDTKGKKPPSEIVARRYEKELKGVKPIERVRMLNRLSEAKNKGTPLDQLVGSDTEKAIYKRVLDDEGNDKVIQLPDESQFQILPSPDPEKREVFYIAGASGSGKSYIAKGIAEYYKKLFPDREIYLVSKLQQDDTLDKIKPKRISIDSLIEDYPELEEFENCLIIFDDYDTFVGPAEKVVSKLIDDLATMGRHTHTTMLCLSHYLTQYKKTRLILNEATHIVVYPQATSYHALKYLLKNYVGVEEEDIKDMRKWGSRWLCFRKNYPQCVIAERKAKMLHCD
jgi:hypothetical protein